MPLIPEGLKRQPLIRPPINEVIRAALTDADFCQQLLDPEQRTPELIGDFGLNRRKEIIILSLPGGNGLPSFAQEPEAVLTASNGNSMLSALSGLR